ncbi:MAG: glycosyl transferase [Alphaproteobacteria bacterium RIFCSPLOWO2_01_FULL_45_8]|nr:MAG: glycosyl transferase [Alphaproteobacteria bacterium GWA1_45_9]OFW89499.1 MAG: glycosyl transferase [Alphaproteobacteria bacterium RIFCSPHIGHO2_01_FULL_41_14]OFW95919.1 MAG: glycosyl transferase [Alphaproteobacteria bacterium RIFCSPLOWO2_01_FULL_45_8]HCI48868.1 glycosyl transferase [Holosporales bacterium]
MTAKQQTIALIVPCYNEELTIKKVIEDFKKAVPNLLVVICDNNSTDRTTEVARKAGALVLHEPTKGKGSAVRRLFREVQATIYIMVDGDDTYNPKEVQAMISALQTEQLDMVIGVRQAPKSAYPVNHNWGNHLFNWILRFFFNSQFKDIFSGYRVFSHRFVKSFPAMTSGFDIETELSVHALDLNLPVKEINTSYQTRPEGSVSKLKTWSDGFLILRRMIFLFKELRPFLFFGIISFFLTSVAFFLSLPLVFTYIETGLVPRLPTALLCSSLMILSFLSLTCGVILESIKYSRREMKRLHYLYLSSLNFRL